MKSIKRGRGPSMRNCVGSIAGVIFGIIWTLAAASMGAPFFFPLFGIVFIGIGVGNVIYHYRNATGENRYSEYDIVDESEESDPFAQRFQSEHRESPSSDGSNDAGFCPWCGTRAEEGYAFCRNCGKKLPM